MIELNIGPEQAAPKDAHVAPSGHVVNLKEVDQGKKVVLSSKEPVNLKAEIRAKHEETPGRICIVGELSREKQGLGRLPMVMGALLMIFVLNLGQLVFLGRTQGEEALALASEAFVSLQGAKDAFLTGEPGAELVFFSQAEELFQEAQEKSAFLLNQNSPWLAEPSKVQSLRNMLEAGELMAEVGTLMSNAHEDFLNLPTDGSLTDAIRQISEDDLEPAAEKLEEVMALLAEVDLSGTGYAQKFGEYTEKLGDLAALFQLWLDVKEPLLTALGDRYPQDYLVLLMNNDELRTGGGFIGSVAHLQLNDGRISRFDFEDVYELDNRYYDLVEVPTPELAFLPDNSWRLRDSNVYPSFPKTAEQAMWFYDQEGGDGVDGVIAMNLSSVQDLMGVLGPLPLPSLNQTLSPEDFPVVLSTLVEAKTFGSTTPKAVLEEFIDVFMGELTNSDKKPALGAELLQQVQSKQILFYHTQEDVQAVLEDFGLSASLPELGTVEGDYLFTTFTNVGGNKTDRYMETGLAHETHIFGDGSVVNSLSIARTNTFTPDKLQSLKNLLATYGFTTWDERLERVMGNMPNSTGIRIYLPEGAEILEVSGDAYRHELQLHYDPELKASYYYLPQTVEAGQMKRFTILYGLPEPFLGEFQEYQFTLFKQPGLRNVRYRKHVSAPDHELLSSDPVSTDIEEGFDYTVKGALEGDLHMDLLYR